MAIYRAFGEHAFKPDQIRVMSAAYELCLKELGLVDRADPLTDLVAKKIIEIGADGHDPQAISDQAISELGVTRHQ